MMEAALQAGLLAGGAASVDSFGLATTPCMFYSIVAGAWPHAGMHQPRMLAARCATLRFFRDPFSSCACPQRAACYSTPAPFSIQHRPTTTALHPAAEGYEGAIMLTASHMPWNANGLKFFTAEGGFEKSDVAAMLQKATQVGRAVHCTVCRGVPACWKVCELVRQRPHRQAW